MAKLAFFYSTDKQAKIGEENKQGTEGYYFERFHVHEDWMKRVYEDPVLTKAFEAVAAVKVREALNDVIENEEKLKNVLSKPPSEEEAIKKVFGLG